MSVCLYTATRGPPAAESWVIHDPNPLIREVRRQTALCAMSGYAINPLRLLPRMLLPPPPTHTHTNTPESINPLS